MTREEAINYLKSSGMTEEQIKAIASAFTCEDCISRKDAEMCLTTDITGMTIEEYISMAGDRLKGLPSVLPSYNGCDYYDYEAKTCRRSEPCEDTISFPKGTLKKRGKGYVIYNYEWLKANWQTELKIKGIDVIPLSVIEDIKAEIEHIGHATPLIGTNTVIEIIDKHLGKEQK